MSTTIGKWCGRCNAIRAIDEFYPSHIKRSGAHCRECHKAGIRESLKRTSGRPKKNNPKQAPEGCKRCSRCKTYKPFGEFNRNSARGYVAYCRPCMREYNHERHGWLNAKSNEDAMRIITRRLEQAAARYRKTISKEQVWDDILQRWEKVVTRKGWALQLFKKYGITPEQYAEMWVGQGGLCACCEQPEPVEGRKLSVDHCHKTGKVRGLLCTSCNVSIGRFQDSIERLERAIQYLRNHSC
jgi:hypothetical protein